MIAKLIASKVEKQAGHKLDRAILKLDPVTHMITGEVTHDDGPGTKRRVNPTPGEGLFFAALASRTGFTRNDAYIIDIDYKMKTATFSAFGINKAGEKIQHEETHKL